MYRFFVRIFAAGDAPTSAAPLAVTFEHALDRLAQLPQMFIEPDGAFVWRPLPSVAERWQVDGNLFDRGESLFYVELKGSCPAAQFNQILMCLSTTPIEFAFEWVERGLLMNEATFRSMAENASFPDSPRGD